MLLERVEVYDQKERSISIRKHWADTCKVVKTMEARRQLFQEKEPWPHRTLGNTLSQPWLLKMQEQAPHKSL